MKKQFYPRFLIIFIVAFASSYNVSIANNCKKTDSCDTEITGKSFLWTRPPFQTALPELICGFREDRLHAREHGKKIAFQIVPFGNISILTDKMQRYFTPFGKIILIADERDPNTRAPQNVDRDLMATHFGIRTERKTFRSEISFEPSQTMFGLGLHGRFSFWYSEEKNRGFFLSISTPITRVKNEFRLVEKIIDNGGGISKSAAQNTVATMTEAFNQANWQYGRIKPLSNNCDIAHTTVGLADIEVKLGMEWVERKPCHLESYVGLVIPTGNRPTGSYIFEPILGNSHHVGFLMGTSFGVRIWHNEDTGRELRTEYITQSNYLFASRQWRSFDLQHKPFSRYMELYADREQAAQADQLHAQAIALPVGSPERDRLLVQAQALSTPGINLLTRPVDVTPGLQFNITSALVFSTERGCHIEGGYNFFIRRAECIKLACPWKPDPALKHYNGNGLTNPVRDITGNLLLESAFTPPKLDPFSAEHSLANYANNVIKETDLDLASASTPCTLSHTFFASFGYESQDLEYPLMAHLGASYEFSNANNASIERWTIWAKTGVSF